MTISMPQSSKPPMPPVAIASPRMRRSPRSTRQNRRVDVPSADAMRQLGEGIRRGGIEPQDAA
jgi:hypothetical protein